MEKSNNAGLGCCLGKQRAAQPVVHLSTLPHREHALPSPSPIPQPPPTTLRTQRSHTSLQLYVGGDGQDQDDDDDDDIDDGPLVLLFLSLSVSQAVNFRDFQPPSCANASPFLAGAIDGSSRKRSAPRRPAVWPFVGAAVVMMGISKPA